VLTDTVAPKRSEPIRLDQTYARDSIHSTWDAAYRSNPRQDRFDDVILDRVLEKTAPPSDALFLDAGCGPGHHSLRIAERGYGCLGLDISETMLEDEAGSTPGSVSGALPWRIWNWTANPLT